MGTARGPKFGFVGYVAAAGAVIGCAAVIKDGQIGIEGMVCPDDDIAPTGELFRLNRILAFHTAEAVGKNDQGKLVGIGVYRLIG